MVAASGCAGSPGKTHSPDARVPAEPAGDLDGIGALAFHAQGEGLDAAHGEIGFEGAEQRPVGAGEACAWPQVGLIADDDAAQHVAVAGQVLGEAVHDEVRAQLEGANQQRRGEGVVDQKRGAGGLGELGNTADVADAQHGIRDRLHEDAAGAGFGDGALDGGEVVHVHVADGDAEGLEDAQEEVDGGAVDGLGGEHRFGAAEEGGEDGDLERHHAGGAGERAVAGFE